MAVREPWNRFARPRTYGTFILKASQVLVTIHYAASFWIVPKLAPKSFSWGNKCHEEQTRCLLDCGRCAAAAGSVFKYRGVSARFRRDVLETVGRWPGRTVRL